MSKNLKLKRVALVAISAMGLGMLGITPAKAGYNGVIVLDSLTVTTATATTNVGTAVSSTFKLTSVGASGANDYVDYVISVDAPATSALNNNALAEPLNGIVTAGSTAAAVGTAKFLTTGAATVTDWEIAPEDVTDGTVIVTDGALRDESAGTTALDHLRGGVSINPDVTGTYIVTITATPYGADNDPGISVSNDFVVTAVSAANSFYVHASSAVSGVVKCSQAMTSNASTTITAGGGTCLATGNIGQGVWTPEDGFMGTIAAVATGGGGTGATLSAASPEQTTQAAAFYTGVRAGASQRTLSGVNASAISSLMVETNAAGLFNLRWPAISGVTTAKARALINGTQIGISDITAKASDSGILVPFSAPVAAGTYNVTLQASLDGTFGADTVSSSFTLTVTAAAADTYGSTTVAVATPSTVDSDGVIYASAAVSATATAAATFTVIQRDINGTALSAAAKTKAATYTLEGVGSLATTAGTTATNLVVAAAGSAVTQTVSLYGTGTAGTAKITFSVNGVVVTTKTIKMYGNVASVTVTPVYTVAPDAGRELGSLNAGSPAAAVTAKTSDVSVPSSANDPAFAITHKDSAGNVVPVVPSTMTSSNNAVILSGITASFVDAGTGSYTQGFGVAHVTVSSAAAAKSGDKADVTFAYTNSNGTTITATAVPMTIGGDLTKVTLTTDKATYAPGEAITLTFKGVDAAGNPAYDGQNAIYSLTSSKQMQNLPSSRYLLGGTRNSSSLLPVFAPAVSGPVTLNFIENTASLTKYAVTFTVSASATDAAAEAAADAAAEAIDAANAATDAANLAAEAADAATVAAEEARDAADAATAAVEALATEVATLMAALKAQITTLANTVAKIAKKVKA